MALAFCPSPSCQREQPVDVDMDGIRHCGVCRRTLGPVPPERLEAPDPLQTRLTTLEAQQAAVIRRLAKMDLWARELVDQLNEREWPPKQETKQ